MSSRKQKVFRLIRALAGDFERVCTILGISEQDALEQAVRDWLKKNQLQTSMETWLKTSKAPVIFQNLTMVRMQVNIVKNELEAAVKALQECDSYERHHWLKTLQKIYPTATQLLSETRDPELEQLIRQVEVMTRERSHDHQE